MKTPSSIRVIRLRHSLLGLVFALSAFPCAAAPINKAATGTNLNDVASWVGGVVPTASDIATWDSASLGAGLTMAAYLPLGGISVGSASSDIDISGGGWLSLGGGIDMSASTVNLTLGTTYGIDYASSSTWTVNAGKTLTVGTTPGSVGLYPSTDSVLTVGGAGNTVLNAWSGTKRYTLTKTGTGTLTTGSQLRIAWGNVNVQDGVLSVQSSQLIDGNYHIDSGAITVSGGGVLELQNWEYGGAYNLGGLRWNNDAIVFNGGTIRMNNTADTASTNRGRGFTIQAGGATLEANGSGLWVLEGAAPDNSASGPLTLIGSGNGQIDKSLPGTAATATLTKTGTGTWTLNATNTYAGTTTVNNGTLALGSSGSLHASSSVSIAEGATFDVSALTTYTLGSSASLTASGAVLPAVIRGGATVDLGSRPITLNYDGAHPALTISQGDLALNGNAFTVNGSVLAPGTYTIIQQASGSVSGSGTYLVSGTVLGDNAGVISVSDGNVNLQILAQLATPFFTPIAGGYLGEQSVTISSTAGSTIYYTTDGSDPKTPGGTRISGPSPITGVIVPAPTSLTINAYATKDGNADSLVGSAAYVTVTTPIKAGTGTDLNASASWVVEVVPTDSSIATWDSSSLCAGLTLGSSVSWGGISVAGAVSDIDVTGAGPLTLGFSGIDLTASAFNLKLDTDVTLGDNQAWTVASGMTLTIGSIAPDIKRMIFNGKTLTIGGEGNTVLNTWGDYESGTLTKTGSGTLTTTGNPRLLNSNVNIEGGVLSVQSYQLYAGYAHSASGAITLSGGGVLELQNWSYGLYENLGYLRYNSDAMVINGGTIRMSNTVATGDGRGFTIGSGGATLDANGGSNLWLHTGGTITNTANGSLTLTGSGLGQLDMVFSGTGALTKSGTGTWTLGGANTYSGDTTVNEGVLAVTGNSIPDTGKLVITSGKVSPTGTEVVGTLFFGLDQKASGTWGATDSGAEHIDDVHFAGTGMVSVTGPGISYAAWIETEFPGETDPAIIGPDADPDHDGIPNLVEYALKDRKANTSDGPAGTFTGGLLSFAKRPGTTGITYAIQESDDLGVSDLWTSATPTTDTSAEITLQLLPADRAKRFARLNVTQP